MMFCPLPVLYHHQVIQSMQKKALEMGPFCLF